VHRFFHPPAVTCVWIDALTFCLRIDFTKLRLWPPFRSMR
jgi:hypothetical protein